MHTLSKKEKYLVCNTLNCVPVLLQGHAVWIDLLNENSVAGRVTHADGAMNITMEDVVYTDRNGQQYPFDEMLVRQRMIRQIHLPPYMDMQQEVQHFMEHGLRKKVKPGKGKRTFKQKRAEERHKQTVEELKLKAKAASDVAAAQPNE